MEACAMDRIACGNVLLQHVDNALADDSLDDGGVVRSFSTVEPPVSQSPFGCVVLTSVLSSQTKLRNYRMSPTTMSRRRSFSAVPGYSNGTAPADLVAPFIAKIDSEADLTIEAG
jgi:hypothetical protein